MRILIVEDDAQIAEFIGTGFQEAGFQIVTARTGPDGLACALTESVDVAVVDIMLPELDGITLIKTMRDRNIRVPILILSAKTRIEERVRGLEAGGDDYLIKPFAFTELLARINALVRRARGTGEETALEVADLTLDILSREVHRGGEKIDLQPREFDLLAYLMRNARRVVSKTMIMENVWQYNFDPRTNVVEARVSKLRDKVDRDYEPKLIHTVRGAGYVLRIED